VPTNSYHRQQIATATNKQPMPPTNSHCHRQTVTAANKQPLLPTNIHHRCQTATAATNSHCSQKQSLPQTNSHL